MQSGPQFVRIARMCLDRPAQPCDAGQKATIRGVDERAKVARHSINQVGCMPRQVKLEVLEAHRLGVKTLPVFDPDQDNVDPLAVLCQHAAWIEQLLEDLVVGSKLNRAGEPQFLHPETERSWIGSAVNVAETMSDARAGQFVGRR